MSQLVVAKKLPKNLTPSAKWAPAFYTPRKNISTDGDEIIQFAEQHFTVLKGFRSGEPLVFTNWQKWLLRSLYERDDITHRLRYRRALIGLPRKQGKSLMLSAVGVYGMIAGEAGAEVYAIANDRQQARIIFGEAKLQIMNNPTLAAEAKVYRDAIEMARFGSVFRVLSSEFKGQAGLNPSLVLFDELWGQSTSDLYDQMTLGSGARIEPLTVSITTAGFDIESLAGKLYQYGKQVASGKVDDDQFGFFWYEAPKDCKVDDRKAWRVSNPNLAEGLLDPDDLAVAVKQTSEMGMRRWRLNQWVRTQESWLPIGAWEGCESDLQLVDDLPVFVGIDISLKRDASAVVIAQPQGKRIVVRAQIWQPTEVSVIDILEIERHLRELHLRYEVQEFAYDPAYFQRSAEVLVDDGFNMVEYPQNSARMVPSCGQAYELIVNGKIAHDGSPTFTDHVLSAAQKMTDTGFRLSKGRSKRKIDACIALVIALDRATLGDNVSSAPSVLDVWKETN